MKNIFCLLFVAFFFPVAAFQVLAHENKVYSGNAISRNSITGFVFSSSRQPVADIYVELLSDLGTTLFRTKTSGSGFYSFRGLSDGRYGVKVLPYNTNFIEQTRSISLFSISAVRGSGAVSEQVDFYLREKKDNQAAARAAPGVIFVQEVPKDAESLYNEGVKYLNEKKDEEGLESLKKALGVFPDYYLALERLGTEYLMRGEYQPAFDLLSKAVRINSKSFSANFALGLTFYRLQKTDKAVEKLHEALEISADSANANLWLGIVYLQKGDLSKAEDFLVKANKLSDEKSADVHFQLAKLYNEQKKFRQSADELELFLKYNAEAKDAEKIKETIARLRKKAGN